MEEKILNSHKVSEIAKFLKKKFIGSDIDIEKACSINNLTNNQPYRKMNSSI